MKLLLYSLLIVFLSNCTKTTVPKTAEDLLYLSLEATSDNTSWDSYLSNSSQIVRTTEVGGNIVDKVNLVQFFQHSGYERMDTYRNGKLYSSQFHTPVKHILIGYNGDKKGYTDIPEKKVYKSPVLELLNNKQNLVLSDTLLGFENVFKLTDTVNHNTYLFNKTNFFLISKKTQTGYGAQTETFEVYKTINGYTIPTRIKRSIPESAYVQEDIISDVKINKLLSEQTFFIDESDRKILTGKQIPDFNFKNLDNANEVITPKKLKGKTVLIDFWATWCSPCIKEIPNIEKLYDKYKDKNFEVVSVSLDNNERLVAQFRENRFDLPWINAILTKGFKDEQAINMEVSALPKVILIDTEGKIIATDEEAKGELLEKLLTAIYTE